MNAKGSVAPPVQASQGVPVDAQIAKRRDWERTMQAALAELVRGQLSAAQVRYREAVRLLPREAAGFRGLGLVSARLGDPRTAREALQRYLELAPAAPDAAAIRARLTSLH
jgi:regulator of sirC expression with transglutaminase-like and TPR domain